MDRKRIIPISVDGEIIYVNAAILDRDQDVGMGKLFQVKGIKESISRITEMVYSSVAKIGPSKASLEIGFELGIKSGEVIAFLVDGDTKGSIKLTLEWEKDDIKQ